MQTHQNKSQTSFPAIKTPVIIAFFILLTYIFYSNSLRNGFSLDDDIIFNLLAGKSSFKDLLHLFVEPFNRVDYRPIAIFSFGLENHIFGVINPSISHGINLVLYVLTAITIFFTIQQLPITNNRLLAVLTCILFICLPAHNSVVNNLKSRDGLFSMLFSVLVLHQLFVYLRKQKIRHLLASVLFFVLAYISKRDAISLIFIVPISIIYFFPIKRKKKLFFMLLLPILVFVVLDILIESNVPLEKLPKEQMILFTENPLIVHDTFFYRSISSIVVFWKYIVFMLKPYGYYFYFGYNTVQFPPFFSVANLFFLCVHLAALIAVVYFFKRNKIISYSILFFYSALIYCSGIIVLVGGIIADRYAYIASLGFCMLLAALFIQLSMSEKSQAFLSNLQRDFPQIKFLKPEFLAVSLALLLSLVYLPFVRVRNADWQNMITLLDADMPKLQQSFEANRIASTYYIDLAMQGDSTMQKDLFGKALLFAKQANNIKNDELYTQESELIAYYGLKDTVNAEQQIYTIIHKFDTSTVAWDLLGDITFDRGRYDSSILCYTNVMRLEPEHQDVARKYTMALNNIGAVDSAFQFNKNLYKKDSTSFIPYENIAYLYLLHGDSINAVKYFYNAYKHGLKDATVAPLVHRILIEHKMEKAAREVDSLLRIY